MKKLSKLFAMLIACIVTCTSAVACGPKGGGVPDIELDPNKETILLEVFGGGFGTTWAIDVCNAWNKSEEGQASDYQFTLSKMDGHLDTVSDVATAISAGVASADIIFCDDNNMTSLKMQASKLLDLSDVWNATPDANKPNRTVKEKFFFADEINEAFNAKVGGQDVKIALPYTMGTSGIVYDVDLFEQMEWLFTDSSTANGLTVGRDGVEGTYDDGLPVTIDDYAELLNNITTATMYPYILYGTVDSAGTAHVINAITAQHEGVASFVNGYDFTGEIYRDGQYIPVTARTGYKVYEDYNARAVAVQFLEDYIVAKNPDGEYKYLDPKTDDVNHLKSESNFIYSHDNGGRRIAMTINGAWWENEAKAAFNEEKLIGNLGYGERRFAFMPAPTFDGQNPDSTKAVFSVNTFGSCFAVKSSDAGKNNAMKSFLTFYSSNAGLNMFNKAVGVAPGYKFEIEDDVYDSLTHFGKVYYEICNSEYVEIVAPTVYTYLSPINYSSTKSPNRLVKSDSAYEPPFKMMVRVSDAKKMTANEIIEAWKAEWTAEKWGTLIADLEARGFVIPQD